MDLSTRSGPACCANYSDSAPALPYPRTCGVALFEHSNATETPYDVLKGCCASGQVGYYPSALDDCFAYCNSTTQFQQRQVENCLSTSLQLSSFACTNVSSSGGPYTVARSWGTLLGIWISFVGHGRALRDKRVGPTATIQRREKQLYLYGYQS